MVSNGRLSVGLVQLTWASVSPQVATTLVGANSEESELGVTSLEATEATLLPMALVATAVKV